MSDYRETIMPLWVATKFLTEAHGLRDLDRFVAAVAGVIGVPDEGAPVHEARVAATAAGYVDSRTEKVNADSTPVAMILAQESYVLAEGGSVSRAQLEGLVAAQIKADEAQAAVDGLIRALRPAT
jgi:hypothetical protein